MVPKCRGMTQREEVAGENMHDRLTCKHSGLDSSTQGDHLVGVHSHIGLLACQLLNQLLHCWDTSGSTHQDDLHTVSTTSARPSSINSGNIHLMHKQRSKQTVAPRILANIWTPFEPTWRDLYKWEHANQLREHQDMSAAASEHKTAVYNSESTT